MFHQPSFNHSRPFTGNKLLQIAMPMGGIGAGCICLSGFGALQDWSIRNKPSTTALPDGHAGTDTAFATLRIKGSKPVTRLLEGPMPPERIYDQGLQSQGYRHGSYEGLPRMESCEFQGEYPFGRIKLRHDTVPLEVSVLGWNPFIPLDDRNSGLPCAILEYTLKNTSAQAVEYEFAYHLSHLAVGKGGCKKTRNQIMHHTPNDAGCGVLFNNLEEPQAETFGSASLAVIGHNPKIKAMWFRGGWFDFMSALWREISTGTFKENDGQVTEDVDGGNGASLMLTGKLQPGESVTYPIAITWHFPNVYQTHGGVTQECCPPGTPGCTEPEKTVPFWRPYYAGQWKDAADVSAFLRAQYASLRSRSVAFHDALHASTLPAEVVDAVASNLAIMKSPTVLRQENGNLWAWEGCFTGSGCCHGSCTHVWNYAQAFPHLFPQLERTLREQELLRSMDEKGHINFRAALPDGPAPHKFHGAADGQLGGIMKLYRDWQISGDHPWMERLYPQAKKSLDYCIGIWDPDRRGALFEPHHNTYDIEFWGPDGMCTSVYLGACAAMAAMSRELGHAKEADAYIGLAKKGAAYLDSELFNGEYYYQKILWRELKDQSFVEKLNAHADDPGETWQLLKAEGPKYQYGTGCISDGVIGAWMALFYGIASPQTRDNIRKNLAAIYKFNFKPDLSDHACTQRPGYAMGHEAGLILCSWPHGGQPTLPFVYSDEVWTGIEYQVAAHLIAEGMVEEGLTIVKAVRSRYDGHVRNPFNEYECGSYYARAMASYALLQAYSGFRYAATTQTLWLAPQGNQSSMTLFFSAAQGWGTLTISKNDVRVDVVEGKLPLREIRLTARNKEQIWSGNTQAEPGKPLTLKVGK